MGVLYPYQPLITIRLETNVWLNYGHDNPNHNIQSYQSSPSTNLVRPEIYLRDKLKSGKAAKEDNWTIARRKNLFREMRASARKKIHRK